MSNASSASTAAAAAAAAAAASTTAPPTSLPLSGGVKLLRFIVFNPSFGEREGEELQKILSYCPADDDDRLKSTNVGFADASINFVKAFFPPSQSDDRAFRAVQTQKTKSAFFEAEPGFWLTLTVTLPFARNRKPSKTDGGDDVDVIEYAPDDVHDSVLLALLRHAYRMFAFFLGSFGRLLHANGDEGGCGGQRDAFKARVHHFFSKFVPTLKPASAGVVDLYHAVQFLTLESADLQRVHGFVSRVQDEFPLAERLVLFQQANVVWTELGQEDTRLLYHYITSSLLPSSLLSSPGYTPAAAATAGTADSPRSPFGGHKGRFLAGGPTNLTSLVTAADWKKVKVHLNLSGELAEHDLLVYHAVSATLCLFVPVAREIPFEFYRQFDASVGPLLTLLSADLLPVFGDRRSANAPASGAASAAHTPTAALGRAVNAGALPSPGLTPTLGGGGGGDANTSVRFLYVNWFNRAMKNSLYLQGEEPLGQNVLRVMVDLADSFESSPAPASGLPRELFVKMATDQWVIGKTADQRQVYVVITSKCANLMDAAEEVDRMLLSEFKNICLLDS